MSENIYQNYDDNLFAEVTIPKKYWYFRYKWMCGSKWEDADGVFVGEFADLLLELHSYDPKSWLIMSQQITKEDYDKLEGIVGGDNMSKQCVDKYKALYDAVRQMQRYDGVDKQKYIEAQSKVYEIAYAIQLKLEREEDDDE